MKAEKVFRSYPHTEENRRADPGQAKDREPVSQKMLRKAELSAIISFSYHPLCLLRLSLLQLRN